MEQILENAAENFYKTGAALRAAQRIQSHAEAWVSACENWQLETASECGSACAVIRAFAQELQSRAQQAAAEAEKLANALKMG